METLLMAAIQSSFLLGLLHGVNPCGHSWLVLVPFVAGEKRSGRVILLTCSFLAGTALACIILGASLGAVSQFIPQAMGRWVEGGTSFLLLAIGLLLLYNPHILHNHDGNEPHGCDGHEDHEHSHHPPTSHALPRHGVSTWLKDLTGNKRLLPHALFGIGFVNMIIPCPTVAVMYGYALNSGNSLASTLVFGTYAISTALAVGTVIFLFYRTTSMTSSLGKEWLEPLIMRLAGAVIVVFSSYGLYQFASV